MTEILPNYSTLYCIQNTIANKKSLNGCLKKCTVNTFDFLDLYSVTSWCQKPAPCVSGLTEFAFSKCFGGLKKLQNFNEFLLRAALNTTTIHCPQKKESTCTIYYKSSEAICFLCVMNNPKM